MDNPQTLSEQLAWTIAKTFDESIQKSIYQRCIKEIQSINLDKVMREDYNAVEDYKKKMRERYDKQADSIEELYPNGCFTKDSDGDFIGIDITLKIAIRNILELERLKKRWWQFWKPSKGLPVYKDSPPPGSIDTSKLDEVMAKMDKEFKEFDKAMKDLDSNLTKLRNKL